ncbi:MAG: hypothetical protein JRN11_05430 [Nitrososphaerota archaeon]|nr:hypothetical protein [Nitrososphaerota archaeon]MDG7013091.1 hypothetical protein [Nitrososphaerota archaeon]MDG7026172.1 hypothetical protein [Nitrososphaerota archaeon]
MTIFSVLLFLFLFTTAFFSFLLLFYQAWRSGRGVRASGAPQTYPRRDSRPPDQG